MNTLVCLFLFCSLGSLANAQSISDYFSRIPSQSFTEGTPGQLVNLAKNGQGFVDPRNGFLRLDGDGAQVSLQVALFRFEDKSPLLIVAWGNLEEPDFTHLTLFREKGGKMVKANRNILPAADSEGHRFELPRHGRTILIRNPAGRVISKWTWNGSEFFN